MSYTLFISKSAPEVKGLVHAQTTAEAVAVVRRLGVPTSVTVSGDLVGALNDISRVCLREHKSAVVSGYFVIDADPAAFRLAVNIMRGWRSAVDPMKKPVRHRSASVQHTDASVASAPVVEAPAAPASSESSAAVRPFWLRLVPGWLLRLLA